MLTASMNENLTYDNNKPVITVLLESDFTKEIRIVFKQNQIMKEHQTPFPIVVHLIEGSIDFGVNSNTIQLSEGDILSLEGGVPHDLKAQSDSIVRLTLSKTDQSERVKRVVNQSKQ